MKKHYLLLLLNALLFFSDAFSCTFFSFTQMGKTYFCNNEDYSNPHTEIRFYPSRNGRFGWVYVGFSDNVAQGGVNEKGLCWDWVAMNNVRDWKANPAKKSLSGYPYEKMITECSTVEDAIRFYETYNEPSLSHARIMIADSLGNAAIIGWKDGRMYIWRKEDVLLAFGYGENAVKTYFAESNREKDISFLAGALLAAHQEEGYPTQYSNIISVNEGKIYLYLFHDFCRYFEIDYKQKLKEGYSKFGIPDLFSSGKSLPGMIFKKLESCESEKRSGLEGYREIYIKRQAPQNNIFILLFLVIFGIQALLTILFWSIGYVLKVFDSQEKNESRPKPEFSQIWSFVMCILLTLYLIVLLNFKEAFQVGMPQSMSGFPVPIWLVAHIPLVILLMFIPLILMNIRLLKQTHQNSFYKYHFTSNSISYLILIGLFIYWGFIRVYVSI